MQDYKCLSIMLDCRGDGTEAEIGEDVRGVIEQLAKDLGPLGVEVRGEIINGGVSSAFVSFEYDTRELERLRTRNAGRSHIRDLPEASPLRGMTCAEAAAWLDAHREKDRLDALGVAHAEYYRRRKDLAAYLAADEARGAEDFAKAYRDRIERIRPRKG